MRVGIVTPRYPPNFSGGGEVSAKLLADHLQAHPEVTETVVHSFDGDGSGTVDGVEVRRLGTPPLSVPEIANLYAYPALRDRLGSFDAIHAYNMVLHPVVGWLSDRDGFASVATLNSYRFFPKSTIGLEATGAERLYELLALPTTGRVLRAAMRRLGALVALSEAIGDIYAANGFGECRIEHVPNMIDPSFAVPDVGGDSPGCEVLYVGALSEIKGVEYLLRAMEHLPPEYSLRVAGVGDRGDALRNLVADLSLGSRVTFEGWVPYEDVPALYAAADVFVHPGIWPEPLNRTVLEAMQAGLPVVCTDIGGPPEVVPDEEFLCAPRDPRALAGAVERAYRRGDAVGRRNRDHVVSNYAPESVIPQLLSLYRSVGE